MEFIGLLKQKVGERSGDGQNGSWRINSYLLETVEMYPKRMVVEVRDNIELWEMLIGKTVAVKFNIDAREWQGKWFNSLRAYAIKENTVEEQARRTARRMPKPTGEIEGMESASGNESQAEGAKAFDGHVAQTSQEQKELDWDKMGQQKTGEEKGNDDLPF